METWSGRAVGSPPAPRAQTTMASSPPHPVQSSPGHSTASEGSKPGVSGLRRTGLAPRVIGHCRYLPSSPGRMSSELAGVGLGISSLTQGQSILTDSMPARQVEVPARRRGRQKQEFGVGDVSSEFSLAQWCRHWTRLSMNKAIGHKGRLQDVLNPDVEWAVPNPWRKETNPASCTEDGTRRKGPSSQAGSGAGAGAGVLRGSEDIVGRRLGGGVSAGPVSVLIWK